MSALFLLYCGCIVGVVFPEFLDSLRELVRSVCDFEGLTLAFYCILLRLIIALTEFLL